MKSKTRTGNKRTTPVDRAIGDRVRRARLALMMSQQELGRACGVTFQQIQKNERGINRISIGRLVTMAKTLRQPLSYFVEGALEPSFGPPVRDPIALLADTRQGFALANAFLSVADDDLRAAVVTMMETIAAMQTHSCAPADNRRNRGNGRHHPGQQELGA
jgi:transcriptional regulator with XRE-family HTH domain